MLRGTCLLLTLSLALVGVYAFAAERDNETRSSRNELLKLVAEPLPAGAVVKHGARFYEADNLFEYMDGAADIFVLYGVRQMLHIDLRAQAADVSVDVFDMGSPETAFGMYAAERSSDFHFIALGTEGYSYEGMLNFLQGRYYVKLLGFGDGADAILETLARELSARIGTSSTFPALLAKLPAKNRRPHSEQYIPKDPLGHPFLGPAYAAAYTLGDQESKLFVTVARDAADAQQRLKQLEQHFTTTGKCESAPELGTDGIRMRNTFEGILIARTKGPYLILLVNPGEGSEQLVKSAAARLG